MCTTRPEWGGELLRRARARGSARTPAGFSLIELMVVVAIVGILAAIAYPSYRTYVLRSNRTDAIRTLTLNAQILQRCYSQTFAFNTGTCPALSTTTPNGYYTVTTPTLTASAFTLTATATGAQAADTTCNSFTIDQTGKQSALSEGEADESTTCWGSN